MNSRMMRDGDSTWNLFCVCVEVLLYRSVYRKAIIKKIVICCLYQARLGHLNSSQVAIRLAIRIKTFHLKLIFSDDQIIVLLYSRCNNWRFLIFYKPNIVLWILLGVWTFICDMINCKCEAISSKTSTNQASRFLCSQRRLTDDGDIKSLKYI